MKSALVAALMLAVLAAGMAGAAPAAAPAAGANAAVVNGVPITRAVLVDRLLYESTAGQEILDELVDEALVEQAAKAKGIAVTKAEVDARVKAIRDGVGAQLPAYLRSQRITEKGLAGKARLKLLVEKLLADQMAVPEAEAKAAYEKYKDQFNVPETVRLRLIKLATQEQAKAAAERLAKGADFAQLAKELSTDPASKASGGLVPNPLAKAQLPEALGQAAFATQVGQVGGPVEAMGGWCLLKVESKAAAITRSFEQVKDVIISDLRTAKLGQAWEKWIAEKRKAAAIKREL